MTLAGRYTNVDMLLQALQRKTPCLLLLYCLAALCPRLVAQDSFSEWPGIHKKDLSTWAIKTGFSFQSLDELTNAARRTYAKDVEDGYDWYIIENVDAKTLRARNHVLLSTWDFGTGHCMTLFVLKADGARFQVVWRSKESLCTESVLGAATSRALPDGRIVVRFREHSRDFDPEKEEAPVLNVKITYTWDGTTYLNAGRSERPPTPR